jgi:hypothetical protein
VVWIVLVVASAACGSGAPHTSGAQGGAPQAPGAAATPPPGGNNQQGYLSVADDFVVFLQWTEANGQLAGQLQSLSVTADAPYAPKGANASFTGVRNGSNISLVFPVGLGTQLTWTGTLKGDTLSVVTAAGGGYLANEEFHPGTVEDYNKAAAALRSAVELRARQAEASATATAARQQAEASAAAVRQQAIEATCQSRAIGVVGHDATLVFSGPDGTSTCIAFLRAFPQDNPYEARPQGGGTLPRACGVSTARVTVVVLDSGAQEIAGSDLCPYVQRWFHVSPAAVSARDSLAQALQSLQNDTKTLSGHTLPGSTFNAYERDWQTMQKDFAGEQSDANKRPLSCYDVGVVKYDAGVVLYDLGTIHYDDGSLDYDLNSFNSSMTSVTKGISSTQTAARQYRMAMTASTDGTPWPPISDDQISAATSAAQQELTKATTTVNDAKAKAAVYDQEATALNQQAEQLAAGLTC